MISTIEDLERYTEARAEKSDFMDRRELVLERPGLSSEEIRRLTRVFPDLPDGYLRILESYRLFGLNLGYFQPWPALGSGKDFVDCFIDLNQNPENPIRHVLDSYDLFEVAEADGESICIKKKSGSEEASGEIWSVSVYEELEPMAESFERFMILAGNLNQVNLKYSRYNRMQAIADISERLERIGVSQRMKAYWLTRA